MKRNRIAALLCSAALCLGLAGCSSGTASAGEYDWKYIQDKGEMVIGYTVFEPMNYTNDAGEFVGFETEFAQAVCDKLGVKAKFQEINWDNKVTDLESKAIDCVWNGMTITDELKASIAVSDPYIRNMQVIVIRSADADKYTDTASLVGQTIEAEAGSAGAAAIADDANLSQATLVTAPKQTDTLLEVKGMAAEAAVLDYVLANASIGEGTDFADLMMIPGVELSVEEYGVGFRKDSSAAAKVNEAMKALVEDGTLNALAEKYGLQDQLLANQE